MSGYKNHPVPVNEAAIEPHMEGGGGDWGSPDGGEPQKSGPPIMRYLSALNRFKWLIIAITILGGGVGYTATQFIEPEFEVQSTIMMEQGASTRTNGDRGPIQSGELLERQGWQDLLRSFLIADPVVTELKLYLQPNNARDSAVFRDLQVNGQRLQPGQYKLEINGNSYALSLDPGAPVESGTLGDSIGRAIGFIWAPSAQVFAGRGEVKFEVQTPREASISLIRSLKMSQGDRSSFLKLTLTGKSSTRTAATLNAWTEQFVTQATALKKANVMTLASILDGQREYAQRALTSAEQALEGFRVRTVTEPNERGSISAGLEMTNAPVINDYFAKKIMAENLQRDRTAIEEILTKAGPGGAIQPEAILSIPSISTDPAAKEVLRVLEEQTTRETALRKLRETYTDEAQRVKDQESLLQVVRTQLVPRTVRTYLDQLRLRENTLTRSIDENSTELKKIPLRTIEEQRLKRAVQVAEELYKNLDLEANKARLAEAATVPDVKVLDPAVAPLLPTRNTAPVIMLGAIGAAFALGIVLAILLDQVDKRFRYPEQASDELRLYVLGVVPVVDTKSRNRDTDQAAQVVEAFRSIRMNVRYAADPGRPLTVTVTSPGPNDGKSLISSNLALSFAESGARTLLIDGDIRRGELSGTFGTQQRPGLVEYLDGTALIAEVLQPTASHPKLTVMSSGARRRRAPELLATPRLPQLIAQLSTEYDVIVVDSPPLGAGFDAYALATATGNMALVLRAGVTDRRMAKAKLAVVDTLPIRVMGCILNGIKMTGAYQYYSYYQNYAAQDEETPQNRLSSGDGNRLQEPAERG